MSDYNVAVNRKGWVCAKCGARLPKGGRGRFGYIWKNRYREYLNEGKSRSGFYCDSCADAREAGLDY